jgi:hypothetical protein
VARSLPIVDLHIKSETATDKLSSNPGKNRYFRAVCAKYTTVVLRRL